MRIFTYSWLNFYGKCTGTYSKNLEPLVDPLASIKVTQVEMAVRNTLSTSLGVSPDALTVSWLCLNWRCRF